MALARIEHDLGMLAIEEGKRPPIESDYGISTIPADDARYSVERVEKDM